MRSLRIVLLTTTVLQVTSCKARQDVSSEVAGSIVRSDAVPPSVVYHFGSYRHLREDENLTVLRHAWSAITAPHQEFRKGLYVAQHPGYSEQYASDNITATSSNYGPWLMQVELDSTCLAPERIATIAIPKSWFDASPDSPLDFAAYSAQCKEHLQFEPIFVRDGAANACAQVMAAYIKRPSPGSNRSIGIVLDQRWPKHGYWYVADPLCITSVKSSPEDVLNMAASIPEFWTLDPFTDGLERPVLYSAARVGDATFMILLRALLELERWPAETLRRVEAGGKTSNIDWLRVAVSKAARVAATCAANGKTAAFKTHLQHFLSKAAFPNALNPDAGGISYARHVEDFVKTVSCEKQAPFVQMSADYNALVKSHIITEKAPENETWVIFKGPTEAKLLFSNEPTKQTGAHRKFIKTFTDCSQRMTYDWKAFATVSGKPRALRGSFTVGCSHQHVIDTNAAFAELEISNADNAAKVSIKRTAAAKPTQIGFTVSLPKAASLLHQNRATGAAGALRHFVVNATEGVYWDHEFTAQAFVAGKLRVVTVRLDDLLTGTLAEINFLPAFEN